MSPRRSLALTGAMDPSFLHGSSEQSFEFAFNSSNFSDRVLRIEVVADRKHEDAPRDPKRRKERAIENSDCEPDQINIDHPDLVDVMICEGNDGEGAAMGEMLSDDEIAYTDDTRYIPEPSPVLRVKSVFISSAILAAKSPFFYKLFSNGMLESDLRHATLRIRESEETALLELLSYMYSNKLSTTSAAGVLDVLMAADKFEVTSCMRHCCELLCNLPMTLESALVCLGLPSSISMAHAAQPLMDAAKNFLVTRYKDINKFPEEVMQLPLAGLEAILSSSDLQVASEDVVFDMVIKWSRSQYPDAEERQFVLGSLFRQFVRFPHMTCRKLKKVLSCNELDHELVSKVVMDAVFYKAELPHRQRALSSEDSENQRFTERAYKYRPVKIVEFESPHQQCIVYLDLKKEECTNLFPSGRVYSQAFHIGGHGFFLSAHCNMDLQGSLHCFGLFLGMQERGGGSLRVDYEIAARAKPNCDFASKYRGSYTFSGGKAVGYRNLFGVPWSSFIADDSPFFINGMLHLRADLTIRQPQNDARN